MKVKIIVTSPTLKWQNDFLSFLEKEEVKYSVQVKSLRPKKVFLNYKIEKRFFSPKEFSFSEVALPKSNDIHIEDSSSYDYVYNLTPFPETGDNVVQSNLPTWVFDNDKKSTQDFFVNQVWLNQNPDEGIESYTTINHDSINLTRHYIGWKYNLLFKRFFSGLKNRSIRFNPIQQYTNPYRRSNYLDLANFIIKRLRQRKQNNQWFIGLSTNTTFQEFVEDKSNFTYLFPPKEKFWADPFVLKRDNKIYIFVEEMIFGSKPAHISCLVVENDKIIEQQIVIKEPYHLSYPQLIVIDDNLYMIPESTQNRSLNLYRCVDFPFKWEFEKFIFENEELHDATIIKKNNTWWLFATKSPHGGILPWDELFIYYSDNIDGKWHPHECNPVLSDVRKARPGGSLFTVNGELYRPSQNCGGAYGKALKINKVKNLTQNVFLEETIKDLDSNYLINSDKIHTFNIHKDCIAVDGLRKIKK